MAPCGPAATLVIHFLPASARISVVSPALEQTLPSSPPVISRVLRLVERGGEQAVMDGKRLVAVVEAVDRAVGQREMRHAAEEHGGDAMAVEIKRGDCGH